MSKRRSIPGSTFEEVARSLFGQDDEAVDRWLAFWATGPQRCRQMLDTLFEPIVVIDFGNRRVLDVGCGAAALADVLEPRPAFYAGLDYYNHVVRLGPRRAGVGLLQASGTDVPFPAGTFDYVFALDVLEHVQGGRSAQVNLLRELRRVIGPTGMIFLTTPNRWYPREGHTGLIGPQYLPRVLADLYIGWRRPSFLVEHTTFGEITSLGPRAFRQCLDEAGLRFLHELPCGMDRDAYRRRHPLGGLADRLGLGWWPHAEFWGVLVRSEYRAPLRGRLRNRNEQPDAVCDTFQSSIDFSRDDGAVQLDRGWHLMEVNGRAFRWTSRSATAWLADATEHPFLRIEGFSRKANCVTVWVGPHRVGEIQLGAGDSFDRTFLIPHGGTEKGMAPVRLECLNTFQPEDSADVRELGVAVFSLGLTRDL